MLCMTSGGDHSAFVMGMLKGIFLNRPEVTRWTKIAGVSAGALLASKISQIHPDDHPGFIQSIDHLMHSNVKVCRNWSSLGKVVSYAKAFLWHESLFKSQMIDIVKPEWGELCRKCYVGAFNESKGVYRTFGPKPTLAQVSASASVPVAFRPVKIGDSVYCDGAMKHIIPVNEIKKYWTNGDLDLLLCYPTDYESYLKTSNSPSKFKLVDEFWNSLTSSQWVIFNNDLDDLARFFGQDIRKGGTFDVKGRKVRVYIPKNGIYCDFINRNSENLKTMHAHGIEVANDVLA